MQAVTEPKITVLIPTTGLKQNALISLLRDIVQQEFSKADYEVLVVLNGVSPFQTDIFPDKNFKFFKIENRSANEARFFGMQKAIGEIILMLDDDVRLPDSKYFCKVLRAHRDASESLAIGGFYKSAKDASMLDRAYNLDTRLSLLASRRGRYSVDLVGGCVSYKRNKLIGFNVWPHTKLAYGASETEFHHRLFQAGALLKLDASLSVIHKPEMSLQSYCRKAYLQGKGFKNYCRIQNGPKRKLKLGKFLSFAVWMRELFFSWGKGDFILTHPLIPLSNLFLHISGFVTESFSKLKWGAYNYFNRSLDKKRSLRQVHYTNYGTVVLISDIEKQNDSKLHLNHTWIQAKRFDLGRGISIMSFKGIQFLNFDISFSFSDKDIKLMLENYPDLPIALCSLNEGLTPFELKRNQDAMIISLEKLKYRNKIHTFVAVDPAKVRQWPEPKLIWTSCPENSDFKISVVIPFFNHQDFVKKVVQSLCEQEYSHSKYEIVLVSDGSSEDEWKGLFRYIEAIPNFSISLIQWDKSKTKPTEFRAGMARQIGAYYAKGEILSFLDSDILVQPNYLADIEKALEVYDIVQSKRRMLDQSSTAQVLSKPGLDFSSLKDGVYPEDSYWEKFKETKEWEKLWAFWKYTCTYSLSLSRKRFFELGGFRPQYNQYGFEDVDLGYRGFLDGLRFGFVESDVFHLYPQGAGEAHHFDLRRREGLLVKSCETFYRLNLSPALYEEFDFFLQGRRFNYSALKPRDFARFTWWNAYFLAVQHNVRIYSHSFYFKYLHVGYYRYVHSFMAKPYYVIRYQWNKRVLGETTDDQEDNTLLLLKK